MAKKWRAITTHIWSHPWFRGLDADAQRLWLYLLTCPESDASGLFRFDVVIAAARLRVDESWVVGTLRDFDASGQIVLGDEWWLLVPAYLKHQPGFNPNIWRYVLAGVSEAPEAMQIEWLKCNKFRIPKGLREEYPALVKPSESLAKGLCTETETETETETPLPPTTLGKSSGAPDPLPLPDVVGGFLDGRQDDGKERQRLTAFVAAQAAKLSPTPVRRALAELADGLSQGQSPANIVAYLRPILKRHTADYQREVSQRQAEEAEHAAREQSRAEAAPPPAGMAERIKAKLKPEPVAVDIIARRAELKAQAARLAAEGE